MAVVTQLHHMYANCKRITYYLNTCGVALCPLSLFLSLSQTILHWLVDIGHETHIYVCVRLLTLQCWFHVCYDVKGLAALLRIDTYMILLSVGSTSILTPSWMCWRSAQWFCIFIYSASWFVSCFFCISLYIFIETPYNGLVALPIVLCAIWLIMFPTRSKSSSRISKRLQKEIPSQRERQPPKALNKLPSWVKTTQDQKHYIKVFAKLFYLEVVVNLVLNHFFI